MKNSLPAGGDPLSALKDIHPPSLPSWWPPAPGWWLLGGLMLLVALLLLLKELRRYRANRPIRLALGELEKNFLQPSATAESEINRIRRLAALLRRFCLARFPHLQTASLSGPEWIDFLSSRRPAALPPGELEYLSSLPYAPAAEIESRKLAETIKIWIKGQRHPFFPQRLRRS